MIDLADCGWLQFCDQCHPNTNWNPVAQLTVKHKVNKSDQSEKKMWTKYFPDLFSSLWFRSVYLITLVFLFDFQRALYHVNILNVLENHSIWISVLGMQKRASL